MEAERGARTAGLALVMPLLAVPTLAGWQPWAGPSYLIGLGLIVAALWHAARSCAAAARAGWTWFAVTATLWLVGDVLDRWGGAVTGAMPHAPDACWLISYLTLGAGVSGMLRRRGISRALRREVQLDTLVVTVAGAVLVWRFLVAPSIAEGHSPLDMLLLAAYPLGDLMIIAMWAILVLAPGVSGYAQRLISWAMAGTVLVDFAFAAAPLVLTYAQIDRMDGLLLIVNGLLGMAGLHPSRDLVAEPPEESTGVSMGPWRVVLLGLALCAVTTSAALVAGQSTLDRTVGLTAGIAITVTVVTRFYGLVRQRDRAEASLRHSAHHDPLTGVANRLLLVERMAEIAAAPLSDDEDVVAVYVDLDGFKPINDRYGHAAGDQVLRHVAAGLQSCTREHDLVARMGGDEFVVLCPDLPLAVVDGLARRLAESICQPVVLDSGERVEVRASIGLAQGRRVWDPASPPDIDALVGAADRAMYEVKSRARAEVQSPVGAGADRDLSRLIPAPTTDAATARPATA